MAPLPCNIQLHIIPINIFDNFSKWHDFWKVQTIRYDFQIGNIIQVNYVCITNMEPWKQIWTQSVVMYVTFFHYSYINDLWIYITNIVFFNVNVLTYSFCIKNVYVPFENCKYYVSIFYKVWVVEFRTWKPHITHNVNYNFVALLLGCNQVFFHPGVLDFLPICFPHILSVSGKPQLFSWGRLDSSVFVCTSYGQKSRVEVSSCSCHLK